MIVVSSKHCDSVLKQFGSKSFLKNAKYVQNFCRMHDVGRFCKVV